MSVYLGPLYHWSPIERRAGIRTRGLRPRTYSVVCDHPVPPEVRGHFVKDHELERVKAVCLGTSPALAWALSGVWTAQPGDVWDLWEVNLDDDDEVHVYPVRGRQLAEVRVLTPLPRSRVWHVGSRVRGAQRWYHAP